MEISPHHGLVSVGPAPDGCRLELRRAEGASGDVLKLVLGQRPPDELAVVVDPRLNRLLIEGGGEAGGYGITVDVNLVAKGPRPGAVGDIELALPSLSHLAVRNGDAEVKNAANVPAHITLESGGIFVGPAPAWQVRSLRLVGECHFRSGHPLAADRTIVHKGARFQSLAGSHSLGRLEPAENDAVELTFVGGQATEITGAPPFSRFELENGAVRVLQSRIEDSTFRGAGRVQVGPGAALLDCRFDPTDEVARLILHLVRNARAVGVAGSVDLQAEPGAVCIGDDFEPLRLLRVNTADQAQLEHLDLYSLHISDLWPLGESERLQPWIPRRKLWSSLWNPFRHPARHREDQMDLTLQERAHFWSRLALMLRDKHSTGAVQSEVRYAAQRARLKALPRWDREKLLLALYSIVGFGERIRRPIVWHVLISATVAAWPVWPRTGADLSTLQLPPDYLATWWALIRSPLVVLRLVAPEVLEGLSVPDLLVLLVQVIGVILIAFSLLAVRRVTKGE